MVAVESLNCRGRLDPFVSKFDRSVDSGKI